MLGSAPMRRIPIALVLFFFLACGKLKEPTAPDGGGGDPIDPTATFTRVQSEILAPTCAQFGCHDLIGRQQGLIMASGRGYANTVGKPSTEMPQLLIVQPSDPANSYLYRKITGSGITGDRMPQGKAPLSADQIKLIRDWIRRGAPND